MALRQPQIASIIILFLLSLAPMPPVVASSQPYKNTTAFVQASSETLSPNEILTINAGGGPLDGGMILNYPTGVILMAQPKCHIPCGSVRIDEENTVVNVDSLGSEISVELQFQVHESVELGEWLEFTVTIVGGNPTIRMSSTSVQVVAAEPPTQTQPASGTNGDVNAMAFTSPRIVYVEPGSMFHVDVSYGRWGALPLQTPSNVLWVKLPPGISIASDPMCGIASSFSQLTQCSNMRVFEGNSSQLIFNPAPDRVLLHLQADDLLQPGESLELGVKVTTSVEANSIENPLKIQIFDLGALPTASSSEKLVAVELHQDFRPTRANACEPTFPLDLSLYSWGDGGSTMYGTAPEYSEGLIIVSSSDPEQTACRIFVRFHSVPINIDRMLLATTSEPGFLCRACVLETILPSENAIVVVPIGYVSQDALP